MIGLKTFVVREMLNRRGLMDVIIKILIAVILLLILLIIVIYGKRVMYNLFKSVVPW